MSTKEIIFKSKELLLKMQERRSVRMYQETKIPLEVLKNCINIAATAPSGANMQPWTFVLVTDKNIQKQIRIAAEEVEKNFYTTKILKEWKGKLDELDVNYQKPFLEQAPYLICIFVQRYSYGTNGLKQRHYYAAESVGIATGMLISSLHQLGLSTLTYTPAPMNFLTKILDRPNNERPYMILPVGYASETYSAPKIIRKKSNEYLKHI